MTHISKGLKFAYDQLSLGISEFILVLKSHEEIIKSYDYTSHADFDYASKVSNDTSDESDETTDKSDDDGTFT